MPPTRWHCVVTQKTTVWAWYVGLIFCSKFIPEALKDVGLLLVGPFDVLSGKLKEAKSRKPSVYVIHWRYYYDPPEFQVGYVVLYCEHMDYALWIE
jgi:hypothetical protein